MKTANFTGLFAVALLSLGLGCGQSEQPTSTSNTTATPPAPASRDVSLTSTATALVTNTQQAVADVTQKAGDLTSKLTALAGSDSVLGSLAGELAPKLQSLGGMFGGDASLKGLADSALQSLTAGKDSDTMRSLFQLSQAKLNPEQSGVVGMVRNLAAAYVIQKNFGKLTGSESTVGAVVGNLRKGEVTGALPGLKQLLDNNKLDSGQKGLLADMVAQFMPAGLKNTTDAVNQGLNALKGLGK